MTPEPEPTPHPLNRPAVRDPIATAVRLHDRALAARDAERPQDAADLAARSLRILEREMGPDAPDVANVLNAAGRIQQDLGEYRAAEALFRRSVAIMQDLGGDPEVERVRVQSFRSE